MFDTESGPKASPSISPSPSPRVKSRHMSLGETTNGSSNHSLQKAGSLISMTSQVIMTKIDDA